MQIHLNMFIFSINNLIIFNLILLCLIFIFDRIRKTHKPTISAEDMKRSFLVFQKYLDRYYIKNMYYTIVGVFIYIGSNFLIFLILRYVVLGQIVIIQPQENNIISGTLIFNFICILFLFVLFVFLFKTLIEILFYQEVIKLRIYLEKYKLYTNISDFSKKYWGYFICDIIGIICFRIALYSYNSDFFNRPVDCWHPEQIDPSEYNYRDLYENKRFESFMENCMYFSKKYMLISKIFLIFAYTFRYIKYNCEYLSKKGFFYYNIYSLLIIIFIFDIYNKQFYYIYYVSIYYYIIYMYRRYRKFERNLISSWEVDDISRYFYKNSYDYAQQRVYILNDMNNPSKYSEENQDLERSYENVANKKETKGIIYGIINNMQNYKNEDSIEYKQREKKGEFTYIRYNIILIFIFLEILLLYEKNNYILEIFNIQIPLWFSVMPMIIIVFTGIFIYRDKIEDMFQLGEDHSKFEENPKYKKIFKIMCIFQLCVYWLILVKPVIILMETELLYGVVYIINMPEEILNIYNMEKTTNLIHIDFIKIEKIYSIEEKILYLFQYFEQYMPGNIIEKDYLRYLLRKIDFESLITKDTKLIDIRFLVESLIGNYYNIEFFVQEILEIIIKETPKIFTNQWYIFLKNIIGISAFMMAIYNINKLILLGIQIQTIKGRYDIISSIIISYKKCYFNKDLIIIYINQMFEKLKEYF